MKDVSPTDLKNNIPLAARHDGQPPTTVLVGDHVVGGSAITIIAGPCTIESLEQLLDTAACVKAAGAHMLRGGAYKPLTFPYRSAKVYEMREAGLEILREVRRVHGLPVVTEVVDVRLVDVVAATTDVLQIGARSMQNFPLLEECARTGKPIILKRHFGASLRDWLGAAEYILYHDNPHVILCERGVSATHTHHPAARFVGDIQVIPAAREITHLPIIFDPSHATFRREYVPAMSRAAVAAGADGLLIEVHPNPTEAAIDPLQALGFDAFVGLMELLRELAPIVGRQL
jgi:3-deoxy-7-phosphoheptulonate synthase